MSGYLSQWNPFRKGWNPFRTATPVESEPAPVSNIASTISKAESELVFVQSLAVWESPVNSVMALIAVNAAFWAVSVLQLQPVGALATVALLHLSHTQWREKIWPEIRVPPTEVEDDEPWTDVSATALSAPEMIRYAERMQRAGDNLVSSVAQFRRNTPLLFLFAASLFWSLLYLLSLHVSGLTLAQLALNLLLTVPAVLLHVLPPGTSDKLRRMAEDATDAVKAWGVMGADCEREFVPESTPETTAYLDAMADLISGRESSPECHAVSAFSSGLGAAPDFDASDHSDDELAPSMDAPAHFNLHHGGDTVDTSHAASAPAIAAKISDANSPSGGAGDAGITFNAEAVSNAAAVLGAQALSSASQLINSASSRIASVVYSVGTAQQLTEESDSDFEFIGGEFSGVDDEPPQKR